MLFLKEKQEWEYPTRRSFSKGTNTVVAPGRLCLIGFGCVASREEVNSQKSNFPSALVPEGPAKRLAIMWVVTLLPRGEMTGNHA